VASSYRLATIVAALFAAGCLQQSDTGEKSAPPAPAAAPAPAPQPQATAPEGAGRIVGLPDFTPLVNKQGPAVVNVVTTRTMRSAGAGAAGPTGDPFFDFFRRFLPDTPPEQRGQGLGSGFIISQDGFILTNAHVVADAEDVTVKLADAKREFKAKVVGVDRRTDVALIKIAATGLPTATLGNSDNVQVGEWVAAIGSPFGFSNTITAGIVSAKGRTLPDESYVPFIQTDVAVNPGNSGGPLLNLKGEVVGINSVIYSQTGGYMGLSFAIPIEVAIDVGKQLQSTGRVTRARLGVRIQELTTDLAQSFGIDPSVGVVVASVERGGPADKAGLQSGDVILRFNGEAIDSAAELPRLVASSKPGSVATLEIWRKGSKQDVKATLDELPSESKPAQKPALGSAPAKPNSLGLVVSELPAPQRKALGIDYGLVVQGVEGGASEVPLRPGDVIVAVNQSTFSSVEQFNELIGKQKPGNAVALLVRRGEDTLYVPVKVRG
jgi:serine protease Do